MIIVRSPLRISLGGGGTDLPTYYEQHGGYVLSAAIDKYVYVAVNESFKNKITLKYSKHEEVDTVDQIEHPIIREALGMFNIKGAIDITNVSDIPTGTGLGSSGSFTAALLEALCILQENNGYGSRKELAEAAYYIERELLKQPIGKQDQYISAFGGIRIFDFYKNGAVGVRDLELTSDIVVKLQNNLLLFFTGYSREASSILAHQDNQSTKGSEQMIENLHAIKQIGHMTAGALLEGDLEQFSNLMNWHWQKKKERTPGMSNSHIDQMYELGMQNGALGGKLVGAGAGGFLMFYANDREQLRTAMAKAGLREVQFKFDFEGTKVLVNS
jgi:D-glycero-alpha-D-manno-heptose-7-phosphate kinase